MSLILDGTNGLSDVDGTAAAPAIRGTDANTGIFFPAADTVATSVAGTEGTRLTSTGLGIGTTAPTVKLEAVAGTGSQSIGLFRTGDATAANNAGGGFNAASSATAGSRNARIWLDADGANFAGSDYFYIDKTGGSGNVAFIQQSTAAMTFATDGTERARIDSSGNLLVGTTSVLGTSAAGTTHITGGANDANEAPLYLRNQFSTAGRYWKVGPVNNAGFLVFNNSNVGQYQSYGATSWTATSDERLKTNLLPIENAAQKVSSLRAVTGRYKTDAEGVSRSFLIAQDVQAVLPEAVDVQDDEQNTLGLRYTEVIPLLVAAIQEQQALITALTTRITALEGAAA